MHKTVVLSRKDMPPAKSRILAGKTLTLENIILICGDGKKEAVYFINEISHKCVIRVYDGKIKLYFKNKNVIGGIVITMETLKRRKIKKIKFPPEKK